MSFSSVKIAEIVALAEIIDIEIGRYISGLETDR